MTVQEESAVLRPGTPLGERYEVREHLARSRCLDVYTVWSRERACLCVAKTARTDRRDDETSSRLRDEGRLLVTLVHPGLVRGYELLETDDGPVAVMEMLPGQTVGHLVAGRRRGLDGPDLIELGIQVGSVLHYLHGRGVLHLDLKPSNIVVRGEQAVVLDLSHARAPGPCPAGFGTVEYMAPEQVIGGEAGPFTDVFGLCGVLLRAATRRRPFAASGRHDDPWRTADLDALRRRRGLPGLLRDLICAGLEPRPGDRPTTAEAMSLLRAA